MPRRVGSSSSMISMARILGAPERVPAGKQERRASTAVSSRRSWPSIVADQMHDVGVALDEHEVFVTLTVPVFADTADVVAAEVDEHDVLGALFFVGEHLALGGEVGFFAGAAGRVPAMGRYSMRRPSTRTRSSGEEPTMWVFLRVSLICAGALSCRSGGNTYKVTG